MKKELEYAKMLESAGFSRDQAEIHLRVIEGAMQDNVATKLDIYNLRSEVKQDIQILRNEFKEDISNLRTELKDDISDLRAELKDDINDLRTEVKEDIYVLNGKFDILEQRLINKIGLMTASAVAVLGGLATLLKFAF